MSKFTVEPIRKQRDIDKVKSYLKNKNMRDFLLFEIGIHTGMRAMDLLKIKVGDIVNNKTLSIKESKTGKNRDIPLQLHLRKSVRDYAKENYLNDNDYIFRSMKGYKPITTWRANRIIHFACKECGLLGRYGMHSLRKTFGHSWYKKNRNIYKLQKIFKHSNTGITINYIGIEERKVKQSLYSLKI
jgi:integrase